MEKIRIQLYGHFQVLSDDGNDLTPVSEKAQAVIALLATSKILKRTRPRLQDTLWSKSNPKKGSDSLRQCLTKIRKSFGAHSKVLGSNRHSVWLDEKFVEIDWNSVQSPTDHPEFLEGIDIDDSNFDYWLQKKRTNLQPAEWDSDHWQSKNSVKAPTYLSARRDGTGLENWQVNLIAAEESVSTAFHLEAEFLSVLSRNLKELGGISVNFGFSTAIAPNCVEVHVRASRLDNGKLSLKVTANHSFDRRMVFNETAVSKEDFGPIQQSFDLLGMAFRFQSSLMREIYKSSTGTTPNPSDQLSLSAVLPMIFSFEPETIAGADNLLKNGIKGIEGGTLSGWRAQIAVIQLIERFPGAKEQIIESGMMHATKAVEADPMNSMVLATAANAHALLMDDEVSCEELARLAVRLNPSNPFAWWAFANASLYGGAPDKALDAAQIGARLAAQSPLQFWCDLQVGLAAIQMGKLDVAIRSLESSAALSPRFRPPRRYLLAIYSHLRDSKNAQRITLQLSKIEPDFSPDRFVSDAEYPISLARSANLIQKDMLFDLI